MSESNFPFSRWRGLMMAEEVCGIEFVGGPLDGYVHPLSFPKHWIAEFVAVPINRRIISLLGGHWDAQEKPASSVAVYRLMKIGAKWRYEFLTTTTPGDFELDHWIG